MTATPHPPMYQRTGALLLRASTHPDDLSIPDDLLLTGAAGPDPQLLDWLTAVWRRPEVQQAVDLASPVLAQQLHQATAGTGLDGRRQRRLALSLVSYLVRWQGRATPFGLFAGVTTARTGRHAAVRFGTQHRAVARADSRWIATVVCLLEADPALLQQLLVVANNTVTQRGGDLIVTGRPPAGGLTDAGVAVRLTVPVRAALDAAEKPVVFAELARHLSVRFPTAAPQQITDLLTGLVAQHLLITDLHAPMTVPDALGHVRRRLDTLNSPTSGDLVDQIRVIHDEVAAHNGETHPTVAGGMRSHTAELMRDVSESAPHPVHIDLNLDADVTLTDQVIRDAEAAADLLIRLAPFPYGYPHWKDYHLRFRRRYGPGAVVALLDLVSDSGLGLPAGYLGSPYGRTPRTFTARDDTLLTLAGHALLTSHREVELTGQLLDALTGSGDDDVLLPPRAEVAFQVHATSVDDVQAGQFRLLVCGAPRAGSSMAGRFADILPDADRQQLGDTYAALGIDDPNAVAAQLSYAARRRDSDNVVRAPALLPQVIALAEHREPGPEVIALDDLAVTADARSFYLVQLSTGRRIAPRVVHALEAGTLTPPLGRFLAEITTARCATYKGFDWGAAARLPYLPRVRHGRIILSAARWLLTTPDLPTSATAMNDWATALHRWRQQLGVPAKVVMCESDLRLPLDLDHAAHRALLRTRLDRAGTVELREAPEPDELGWIGRAHELLLTLRLTRPRQVAAQPHPMPSRLVTPDAGHLPGRSRWLHAQVYGHPARYDDILTGHLPALFNGFDNDVPVWWFRRHREMAHPDRDQHLDLYLRLPTPDRYGQAAAVIADWAATLRAAGLVSHLQLGTYQPQTGRYGHGTAMTAAEDVFAADSAAAIAQLTAATRAGTAVEAIAAAGLFDLARSYAATPADGARWLLDAVTQGHGPLDRHVRDDALRLADPLTGWGAMRATPGGDAVIAAWQQRRAALATYRRHLGGNPDTLVVLRSLLHEHHVRVVGVDPARERVTHRLARAAALRQLVRPAGGVR